jgi:hypothetical protein
MCVFLLQEWLADALQKSHHHDLFPDFRPNQPCSVRLTPVYPPTLANPKLLQRPDLYPADGLPD